MESFAPETLAIAAAIAAAAGVIRGITGFGGAMVMSPPLALLLGPLAAVPVVLLLESLAAAPMLAQTRSLVRYRLVVPIVLAACAAVPLGVWVLVTADPLAMRRVISGTVILFSLVLLSGWRHGGGRALPASLGVGALSGALAGATSMGGPPVILYLLSGPDRIETTRANLTFFVAAVSAAGFVGLWVGGAVGIAALALAALFAPGYWLGMAGGTRLYSRFDEQRFRRFTLVFLALVSAAILLA